MCSKSSDESVPAVFKNPESIKIKSPKKKRSKKTDVEAITPSLQEKIAQELQAQTPNKGEEKPKGAYRLNPPESDIAHYGYHGLIIPDPYRPLEESDSEDVQLWINYQQFRTKQYLAKAKIKHSGNDDLRRYYTKLEKAQNIKGNLFLHEGLFLDPNASNKARDTIGNNTYTLEFHDHHTELIRETMDGEKELILSDKDLKFRERNVRLNLARINPHQTFALCQLQDHSDHKKYDGAVLCLANGKIFDVKNVGELFYGMLAWDVSNDGFYRSIDHKLFYCSFTPDDFDVELISEGRDKNSYWQTLDSLQGGGITLCCTDKAKYENIKTQHYIAPQNPRALFQVPEMDFNFFNVKHNFVEKRIVFIGNDYIYAAARTNLNKTHLFRLPLGQDNWSKAEVVLADKEIQQDIQRNILFVKDKIITIENEDLQSVLKVYSLDGEVVFSYKHNVASTLQFLDFHVIEEQILMAVSNYETARDLLTFDSGTYEIKEQQSHSKIHDFNITTERVFATSKDGTKIPMTILRKEGQESVSEAPTILYAYGGFGRCEKPQYNPEILYWLNQGGTYAFSHARGDGGWVEDWATDGSRLNMQNTYDDIEACGQHLINEGITSSGRLCGMGASNGGRTIVGTMLQNPQIFSCVVCIIPILDSLNTSMSNYEYEESGFFDNEGNCNYYEDFKNLHKISPLHNIKNGETYPPTLIMGQGQDKNAHPAHALKFLATALDRAKNDDFYLIYKKDGDHSSVFHIDRFCQHLDYDIYKSMYSFIDMNLKGINV